VSAGAEVPEAVRPFLSLADKLGRILTGMAEGAVRSVECQYLGRIGEADTRVLTLAAVKGVLAGVVHEPVSFVNAPIIARERGLTISEMRSSVSTDYVNLLAIRAETDDGPVSVAGTLVGKKESQRVISVNGFDVEMVPSPYMLFFFYEDKPGVIGKVGTILGNHDINIATMDVGRPTRGGTALMGLVLDSPVTPEVMDEISSVSGAEGIRFIVLPE